MFNLTISCSKTYQLGRDSSQLILDVVVFLALQQVDHLLLIKRNIRANRKLFQSVAR